MKKILTSILTAGAFVALGQGQINLDNFTANGLVPVTFNGANAVGDKYKALVFLDGSSSALSDPISFNAAVTGARAGRFNGGLVAVGGVAVGAKAKLFVQVWDGSDGATFANAKVRGTSAVFETLPLGGNNPGDPLAPKLEGLTTFALETVGAGPGPVGPTDPQPGSTTPIPEPSTIALGAIGAAALVLRRLRK